MISFSPHARGCSRTLACQYGCNRVFPACAGMFLIRRPQRSPSHRFPRMRGDVPHVREHRSGNDTFSPHARGCSYGWRILYTAQLVFPACAGMFLSTLRMRLISVGFPRMRGDVPWEDVPKAFGRMFSPHARGCSVFLVANFPHQGGFPRMRGDVPPPGASFEFKGVVFPACAGMFLAPDSRRSEALGFPRMRGDVPHCVTTVGINIEFSPHARGCSRQRQR